MYNKYTIELVEESTKAGNEIKAKIYLNNEFCLGTVWNPANSLKTREDFTKLFESVGNVIYGQEKKAFEQAQSDSILLEILSSKGGTNHT